MKQFTLALQVDSPRIIEKIESDDLVQLLSQFQFVLVSVIRQIELDKQMKSANDEIPF